MLNFFTFLLILFVVTFLLFEKFHVNFSVYRSIQINKKTSVAKPIFGGALLFLYFLISIALFYFFEEAKFIDLQKDTCNLIFFYGSSILIFLTGLYDDRFDLSPNFRLLFIGSISIALITFDQNLIVNKLNFYHFETFEFPQSFGVIFTALCILSLINFMNMIDGKNGIMGFYSISLFLYFIFKGFEFYFISLMISGIILFLIFNLRNKTYLGDGGTYLIAFVLSIFLIKGHNINKTLWAEEILILLLIPLLDMIRLIFERLVRGKHPFKGDFNHLHHLLANITSKDSHILVIMIIFMIAPLVTYIIINTFIFALVTYTLIYFILIIILKNFIKAKN